MSNIAVITIGVMFTLLLFPFFLLWIAQEDILFTTVKEGTSKIIMQGKSFKRAIMAFAGYHLNDPSKYWYDPLYADLEVLYHGEKNGSKYDDRPWILKSLGLYWVGWPWANSVYVYAFEWNETYTDEEGKEKVLPRSKSTDFIYISDFVYAIVTESAETKDLLPTDELTLITVAIRNPYHALFSGENWMRRVTAAVNRRARNFVGERSYRDLISVTEDDLTDFSSSIIKLSNRLADEVTTGKTLGLKGRYGVEIRTADLQTIELSGDAKPEHQEATLKVYVAEQEAKEILLKGTAEADVIEIKGNKEAKALKARLKIIQKHSEYGMALAGFDAIQESSKGPGNTVVWANNPLAPITQMLENKTQGGKQS